MQLGFVHIKSGFLTLVMVEGTAEKGQVTFGGRDRAASEGTLTVVSFTILRNRDSLSAQQASSHSLTRAKIRQIYSELRNELGTI